MNRILVLFSLIIITSLFSCKNKEHEAQLQRVDSLYTALKAVETKVLMMDTADYNVRKEFNEEKLKFIQDNFKDTANKEQAIFISDIIATKRSFNKLMKKREEIIEEILYSKGQLVDLKRDVENNLILKNSFIEYFDAESKAVMDISNASQSLISWGESAVKRHEQLKPKIEEFVANIK